jgi:dipeptidase
LYLNPETDAFATDYPFSVKAERPLTAADLMDIQVWIDLCDLVTNDRCLLSQRDHYEGTKYDLTKGYAAGPFGDPNRFDISMTGLRWRYLFRGVMHYPCVHFLGNMTRDDVVNGAFDR